MSEAAPNQRLIGVDPLWQEDPAARAAYSASPQFTDGTATSHPLHCVKDSLLARADIAEALEQIYVGGTPPREQIDITTHQDAIEAPVNATLSLDGLVWLRKNLGKDSSLRRDAIQAKDQLSIQLEQEAREHRQAEAREQQRAKTHEALRQKEQAAEEARRASEEAQKAHNAEAERQVSMVIENVEKIYPDLDCEVFRELTGKLSSSEDAQGEIKVKKRKRFDAAIDDRVQAFLADPNKMVRDMTVLITADDSLDLLEDRQKSAAIVDAYGLKIGNAIDDAMSSSAYDDLTDERIDQWLSAIETVASPGQLPDKAKRLEEAARESNPTIAKGVEKFGKRGTMAIQILQNCDVLPHTLIGIAEKDPEKFVDRMYALAKRGLDPANDAALNVTMGVLQRSLKSPLVKSVLLALPNADHKPVLQKQAIDILMSLRSIGVPGEVLYNNGDLDKLSSKETTLLFKLVLPRGKQTETSEIDTEGFSSEKQFLDFTARARLEKGTPTTVYGRLIEYWDGTKSGPVRAVNRARHFLGRQIYPD